VYILSDCTAAIDMVIHRSRFLKMPDLYNRLKSVQESLLAPNISVGLYHMDSGSSGLHPTNVLINL